MGKFGGFSNRISNINFRYKISISMFTFSKKISSKNRSIGWKLNFWSKIELLVENEIFRRKLNYWSKMEFLSKKWKFSPDWAKFCYLTKNSMFEQYFNFRPKNSIFNQCFYIRPKIQLLSINWKFYRKLTKNCFFLNYLSKHFLLCGFLNLGKMFRFEFLMLRLCSAAYNRI